MDKDLLQKAILGESSSIRDAFDSFEKTALGVVFVCDLEKRLKGVATEGDIRRALLAGHGVNTPVFEIANRHPVYGIESMPREEWLALLSDKIRILPILDEQTRIVNFLYHDSRAFIPMASPTIGQQELKYVTEAILSGWISSTGKFISEFESAFAQRFESPHACAVSNGTVALHLALAALDIGVGDEVILPALTFISPANMVRLTGAKPVFVDVDPQSWTIDPEKAEAAITPRTKAIIPVHLYGNPCHMDELQEICRIHKLYLIEDAAEAHGATYKGKPVGSIGDIGCFSFFGNKIITTGEGGMVLTKDPHLDERLRFLRDHGMSKQKRYWHTEIGYNYRMTNVQAAIGVAQLEKFDSILDAKMSLENHYDEKLATLPHTKPQAISPAKQVCWLYTLALDRINTPATRDQLIESLKSEGIDSRPVFYPIPAMPPYFESDWQEQYPVSSKLSSSGLSLPSLIDLSENKIDFIAKTLLQQEAKLAPTL